MGRQSVAVFSSCEACHEHFLLTVAGISLYVYGSANVVSDKNYFKKHFDAFYQVCLPIKLMDRSDHMIAIWQKAQPALHISRDW